MLVTLLVFILILSLLVFVHELGHFLVAKKAGIKVEEFGFGLPPRLWGKKVGETIYSVNALPIGGFVRLYGEDEEVEGKNVNKSRQFLHKPKGIRAAVTAAGVVMNFLLAVVVFSLIYTKLGIPTETDNIRVIGIVPESPAAQAGLRDNDVIVSIEGKLIKDSQDFINLTREFAGKEMSVKVNRGEEVEIKVTPRKDPPLGEGPLGVVISNQEIKFYPFWQMPFRGAVEGVRESFAWTRLIAEGLGMMVFRLVTAGTVPQDVAGPVGIFQITGQVAKTGVWSVLQFLGVLSINLAVVNLLPIPALDGGRLLFIAIEAFIGRRVKAKVEAYAHQIGMIFLLFLIVLITFNDIRRVFGITSLADYFQRFLP